MFSRKRLSAEKMLELEKKLEESSQGEIGFAKTAMQDALEQEIDRVKKHVAIRG